MSDSNTSRKRVELAQQYRGDSKILKEEIDDAIKKTLNAFDEIAHKEIL